MTVVNGNVLTTRDRSPIVGMVHQKHRLHGVSYGLGEAGYDIRLKQDILYLPSENLVSLRDGPNHYKESTGRFVLASAIEEFDMPFEYGKTISFEDQMSISIEGTSLILDLLEKHQIKATFFSTVIFAINAPEIIKRIIKDGHEIASHSYYRCILFVFLSSLL
jgi:hypothetical protein